MNDLAHDRDKSNGIGAQFDLADSTRPEAGSPDRQITAFVERVDRDFRRESLESFWDLEDEFRQFVHSGFLQDLFNRQLAALVADPTYMADWRPNQLMIHRGRAFALSLWLFQTPRRYIHTTSFYGMYSPVGKESLHYDIYKLPQGYRNAVFDPTLQLEPAGSGITSPGGILLLQSDRYVYDFKVERPVPVLKFTTASFQTLEWLFNKDNLHAWQANDSELAWTQMRVTAYVLGRLAHQSSLESLELLASHSHHAVRWAAIQNLGRVSRKAALIHLEKALDDPHPHVRRAAGKTLQQLKQSVPG